MFDFNQFQRSIFKEIFSNPLQKNPESPTTKMIDLQSLKRTPNTKAKKAKQFTDSNNGGAKAKTTAKRKRSDDQFDYKRLVKVSSKPSPKPSRNSDVYKSPKIVQKTHYELHQETEELENLDKNCRRSLRAKLKKRGSIDVVIEIVEKEFSEIKSQEEFLHFLSLRKG